MKKSDLKILRERNQKAVAPSQKKEDLSDELSKLFDDGTTIEKTPSSDIGEAQIPRLTSAHLTSAHPTSDHLDLPRLKSKERKKLPTAPERDFNRRANSIERDALPAGLFPGASKKLYDALYLRTRGAHIPTRTIQATRTELMKWAGIGSRNTFMSHMRHFLAIGLIIRHFEIGNNDGAAYEVCIPEEIDLTSLASPRLTSAQLTSAQITSAQEMGLGSDQNVIRGGPSQTTENIATSADPKTSFKTKEEKTDDEAARQLGELFKELEREVIGKNSASLDQWKEVREVLLAELKIAAARTSVSSVPSFMAEHLRRRLWKMDKKQAAQEGKELPDQTVMPAQANPVDCPDCKGCGWWYPNGLEKGVAKCKHDKLTKTD